MSDDEGIGSGLLGITLSDSDSEAELGDKDAAAKTSQEKRTGQSEAEFREVKRTYRVKIENGEVSENLLVCLSVCLPACLSVFRIILFPSLSTFIVFCKVHFVKAIYI
jgi:DNA-binding XRE family transcriptional regulator